MHYPHDAIPVIELERQIREKLPGAVFIACMDACSIMIFGPRNMPLRIAENEAHVKMSASSVTIDCGDEHIELTAKRGAVDGEPGSENTGP